VTKYEDPAASGGVKPVDVEGLALLVKVRDYRTGITTAFGEKDAVELDCVVLKTGEHNASCLWFGGRIIGKLKGKIGALVLCKVERNHADAKPGQAPPWDLIGLSGVPEVVEAADKWLAANPGVMDNAYADPTPAPAQHAASDLL